MTEETKNGMEAVNALREAVENYGTQSAEVKALFEKTAADVEAMDAKHDAVMRELAEERKKQEDANERFKELELAMSEISSKAGKADYKEAPEYKAIELFARKGFDALDVEKKQLLRTDDGTAGGYLTMPEMDNMILRQITEISPVRQVARVRSVGNKTLQIPVRTGIPDGARYEGEAAEGPLDTSSYGNETLTAYRLTVTVPFTMDQLMDSQFDLEAEIRQDVAEAFAQREGNRFVLGTGAKQPEGFLTNTTLTGDARTSSASGTFTGDDLIRLTGDIKFGYNPMYAFNRRTLALIRTFKGSDGQYLWQVGLGGGAPNTIAGEPYMRFEDMPDVAPNAFSVVYADFMRGYTIIDRTGLSIVRDNVTRKGAAIVELTFHRWNHGQVVLPESFKLLQCAA